jgi:broad specificity phosphatase PhoE
MAKRMRTVVHARHSMRSPGGVHLTHEGVRLARRVGERLGSFDRVITSEVPRAIETAIAMGYGVDEQVTMLFSLVLADNGVDVAAGCAVLAAAYRSQGQTTLAAQCHASLLRHQIMSLPEGGRLLVVSHGGVIELGVVGLLPDNDYSAGGHPAATAKESECTSRAQTAYAAEILRIADLLETKTAEP